MSRHGRACISITPVLAVPSSGLTAGRWRQRIARRSLPRSAIPLYSLRAGVRDIGPCREFSNGATRSGHPEKPAADAPGNILSRIAVDAVCGAGEVIDWKFWRRRFEEPLSRVWSGWTQNDGLQRPGFFRLRQAGVKPPSNCGPVGLSRQSGLETATRISGASPCGPIQDHAACLLDLVRGTVRIRPPHASLDPRRDAGSQHRASIEGVGLPAMLSRRWPKDRFSAV